MNAQCISQHVFVRFAVLATLSSAAFELIVAPTIVSAQESPSGAAFAGDLLPPEAPNTVRRDEQGRVSLRAVRVDRLKVDGVLDEEVYQTTPPIDGFIQQEPREGDPATDPTETWILFDDENVYFSARCHDSHPERMVVTEMRRDNSSVYANENFTVALDTFNDKRNGYYFLVTAIGALRDGLISDEGNPNYDWNTVFDARVRRDDQGYTLEMVIPFKSIRYNAGPNQVWNVNLRRVIRWNNEDDFITRMPKSYGSSAIYKFSSAATLYGIEVPGTSRNLELKPYAISDLRTDRTARPAFSNDLGADAGFDVKYGLTRSLIADFTYNTDFAQVEDDQQQVNLTRFSLYYPEKREFFLEGRGIFNFGSGGSGGGEWGGSSLTPTFFFSRRIGLSEGQPVPIVAGGRMTGRAGKYTLGLLNIETGRSDRVSAEPTNFSVVRVRRDILRRSTIGFMGANRSLNSAGTGSNQAFGVDANFAFYQNVYFAGYYAQTRTSGESGDDASYLGTFSYGADRYGFSYQHLMVGKDFNPEIGFLRRSDFQRNYVSVRFSPRPKSSRIVRKLYYQAGFEHIANRDGKLETREAQASFQMDLQNGDVTSVEYSSNYEYLPEPFAIATNVTLPVGGYTFQNVTAQYRPGTQHRASGTLSAATGSFYNGTKTALSYGGRVKISNQLLIEPAITLNFVDLREGSFNSNVVSGRTTFTFTPRAFVSALLQYNSASHVFTTNVRFRWEYRPMSDFFIVYSEGRDTNVTGFPTMQNRGFVVKLTKLFRY